MMACTLLKEGGLWVASWTVDGVQHMHACADRQGAAWALHHGTGVWLGVGAAPEQEVAS